jgi:hypothetical protein
MIAKNYGLGDILECKYGYFVQVILGEDGKLVGKLICEPGHSCENMTYSLNDGVDHKLVIKAAPRFRT